MRGNSGIIGKKISISKTVPAGISDAFTQYTLQKSASWPMTIYYNSLSMNSGTLYENTSYGITLSTTGIAVDTTLYWTVLHGSSTSADFYGSVVSGSFTQYASTNTGTFSVTTSFTGNTAKSSKSFQIQIRTGSISGPIVFTSGSFTIPAITISSLYWTTTPVNEGGSSNLYFQLGNCGAYASYTFVLTNSGTISASDVGAGSLTTSAYVNPSYLSAVSGYTFTADLTTEGAETLTTQISYNGFNIGTAQTLTVNDTSTTPTGTITPSTTAATEGNAVTFNCTISGSYTGTAYYTVNNVTGTMSASDFSDNLLSGSFNVTSGTGSFNKTLVADGIVEGEAFSVSLRVNSTAGNILATTSTISVTDAAPPPGPTFTAGVMKSPEGTYNIRATNGWSNGIWAPLYNYDDDTAINVSGIMNAGESFYMGGNAYNTFEIGTNGAFGFGSGSVSGGGVSDGGRCIQFYPGDEYWGTNGPNGTGNSAAGFGYKFGTSAIGVRYFFGNLQGYTYANTAADKTWEYHCYYMAGNSQQWIEVIVPATVNSPTNFLQGPATNPQNLAILGGGSGPWSGVWKSTDYGVTWTFLGVGSITSY